MASEAFVQKQDDTLIGFGTNDAAGSLQNAIVLVGYAMLLVRVLGLRPVSARREAPRGAAQAAAP